MPISESKFHALAGSASFNQLNLYGLGRGGGNVSAATLQRLGLASRLPNALRGEGAKAAYMSRAARRLGKRYVSFRVIWHSEMVPKTFIFERVATDFPNRSKREIQGAIRRGIQERYESQNRGKWKPLSPVTIYDKTRMRAPMPQRPLFRWGGLATDVAKVNPRVHTTPSQITITGLDKEFSQSPQVWFHEITGASRKRIKRPFILDGIQDGLNQFGAAYKHSLDSVFRTKTPGVTIDLSKPVTPQMESARRRFGLGGLVWWLLPPSKAWAYAGMLGDARSFLRGNLAKTSTLKQWLSAYARGMLGAKMGVPTTFKVGRRHVRRALWGTRRR